MPRTATRWLKKFDAYKEAGTLPQGWCKGAPRRLLEDEPPTRPEPADPDAPREEGNPDAPLSYDGFMRYVYDSFHVSIVDELDTARLALSIVNREMENAQFEDAADE